MHLETYKAGTGAANFDKCFAAASTAVGADDVKTIYE